MPCGSEDGLDWNLGATVGRGGVSSLTNRDVVEFCLRLETNTAKPNQLRWLQRRAYQGVGCL